VCEQINQPQSMTAPCSRYNCF